MKIRDIRATTVTVPLEAPLRHANGCHWGRFVRTIVEVETDNGLIGLGEMGGGGESAEAAFRAMKGYLVGRDPARLEEMRMLIANPTASLYNNRTQIVAALEFACLDILGQAWNVPVSEILGGRLRDRIPFAAYCFFRYPDPRTGVGEVRTIDQVVENACQLKSRFGFTTHKVKGGVFHPDYELEAYRAVAAALPGDSFRFDPNAVWSTEQAIRFGQAIEDLRNDYLEDPVFGLNGMRRTRQMVRVPLATNTVVVNFEQLAANVLDLAVDVVLLDTTFWGGIRPCVKAAGVCETFQLGVAVHSWANWVFSWRPCFTSAPSFRIFLSPPTPTITICVTTSLKAARFNMKAVRFACLIHRVSACVSIARSSENTANCLSASAAIRTTRIPGAPAGRPSYPTTAGPTKDDRPVKIPF